MRGAAFAKFFPQAVVKMLCGVVLVTTIAELLLKIVAENSSEHLYIFDL